MWTKEEFLKAAELGEVSLIDATHTVSLLEDARITLGQNPKTINGVPSYSVYVLFANFYNELAEQSEIKLINIYDCSNMAEQQKDKFDASITSGDLSMLEGVNFIGSFIHEETINNQILNTWEI